MNSRWSDELRERMAEYEATAPEALFEQIMEAMPESQPAPVVPLRGWLRWAAVAASVAVIAGGYLLYSGGEQPEENLLAEVEHSPVKAQDEEPKPLHEQDSAPFIAQQIMPGERPQSDIIYKEIVAQNHLAKTMEQMDEALSSTMEQATEPQPAEGSPSEAASTSTSRRVKRNGDEAGRNTNNYYTFLSQGERRSSVAGQLTANIFASGSAAGHSKHGSQQVFQVNSSLFGELSSDMSGSTHGASGDMLLYNSKELLKTDIHHSQPVRFGFTVRYQISERWAVEGGVAYSLLYSRSQMGHTDNYSTDKQSLHYVGVPINGVYNLWSNKRFVLYLSAGAMVEKCVSGEIKTTYTINGKSEKSKRKELMVDELQFSAMAAAGAQVNLSPLVGLYVEPGVGYWFDNGSTVQTIYGEQPLNFNFNVGLRFTLR